MSMTPAYTMQSENQNVDVPIMCAYIAELLMVRSKVVLAPAYAIQSKIQTESAPYRLEDSTAMMMDAVPVAMLPNDAGMLRFFPLNREWGGPGEWRTVAGYLLSPSWCCRSTSSPAGTESDERRPDQ